MIQMQRHIPRACYRRSSTWMLAAVLSFCLAAKADVELPAPLDTSDADAEPVVSAVPPPPPLAAPVPIAASVPLAAPADPAMRFVSLGRVRFASGKAELSDDAKHSLDNVAGYLAANPGAARVMLDGHTDKVGGIGNNDKLSDQRALAVQQYLLAKGLNPQLIRWKGYGKRAPRDENWTRLGRDRNREVELYVIYLPQP